jgi:hypothetical protein
LQGAEILLGFGRARYLLQLPGGIEVHDLREERLQWQAFRQRLAMQLRHVLPRHADTDAIVAPQRIFKVGFGELGRIVPGA